MYHLWWKPVRFWKRQLIITCCIYYWFYPLPWQWFSHFCWDFLKSFSWPAIYNIFIGNRSLKLLEGLCVNWDSGDFLVEHFWPLSSRPYDSVPFSLYTLDYRYITSFCVPHVFILNVVSNFTLKKFFILNFKYCASSDSIPVTAPPLHYIVNGTHPFLQCCKWQLTSSVITSSDTADITVQWVQE